MDSMNYFMGRREMQRRLWSESYTREIQLVDEILRPWVRRRISSPFYLFPTTGGDDMDLWRTDILAALEAGTEGLESAQSEMAKAYREAITHIGLTGAAESETRSLALTVLRAALEHSAHVNQVQPGIGSDVGDLVLDLLYMLATLELLKRARDAIASALEGAWAEVPGSEPSQP